MSDPDYGDDNNFGYEYPLVVTFIYQEHAEIGGVSVGRIEDYKVPHESLCPADDECAYAWQKLLNERFWKLVAIPMHMKPTAEYIKTSPDH